LWASVELSELCLILCMNFCGVDESHVALSRTQFF